MYVKDDIISGLPFGTESMSYLALLEKQIKIFQPTKIEDCRCVSPYLSLAPFNHRIKTDLRSTQDRKGGPVTFYILKTCII